ncbi:unnamed protein product [Mesocestoides corti]|uniref:Intermediate filament tail domain-containing protein n=1 Tax=Mesocestoides corti TaxID=53468 RepID=A0A0R3U595_MESCO|nr:unnamed protein product [Mesocestoides corti]
MDVHRTTSDIARQHLNSSQESQKRFYDRTAHGAPCQRGDSVWLHQPYPNRGNFSKLDNPYTGPFEVVQSPPNNTYRIRPVSGPFTFPFTVHFNRLKSGLETSPNTVIEDPIPETGIPVHDTVEIPRTSPSPHPH